MTDIRIRTAADALALGAVVDVDAWNVGRSELAPGLEVWTSWLPVQGYYETLIIAPTDGGRLETLHHHSARYDTREAAQDGHAYWVQRVRTLLESAP